MGSMSAAAVTAVLGAALAHALWNLLLARAEDRQVLLVLAMCVGSLLFLPLAVARGGVPAHNWGFLAASGVAEAAYMVLLAQGYAHGDFTLVYPLARGLAPALLTGSAFLVAGEVPSALGALGIALLVSGLAVTALSGRGWHADGRAVALAAGVGLLIATYSTLDAVAGRRSDPVAFGLLAMGLGGVLASPFVLRARGTAALRLAATWRLAVPVGVLLVGGYAVVVAAYAVAPIAYVGALREVSIVFAGLLGWMVLGERVGWRRGAALACVSAGAALTALA